MSPPRRKKPVPSDPDANAAPALRGVPFPSDEDAAPTAPPFDDLPEASDPSADELPDIAPPLMLDDIPEPTVLEPEPVQVTEDAYAWAAQAASSMEREGRSFDEVGPFHDDERQGPGASGGWGRSGSPEPATASGRYDAVPGSEEIYDEHEDAHVWVHEEDAAAGTVPPDAMEQWLAEEAAARNRAGAAPAAPANPLPLLLGLAAVFLIGGVILAALALGGGLGGEEVLRPVAVEEQPADGPRFAVPPAQGALPPGATAGGTLPPPEGALTGPVTRLEVLSRPPGATVQLNRRAGGTTPLLTEVRSGTYAVALDLDGHTSVERVVRAQGDHAELVVDLIATTTIGIVEVRARGWEGAKVWVDGLPGGIIPARMRMGGGEHTFLLELGGQRAEVRELVAPETDRIVVVDLAD